MSDSGGGEQGRDLGVFGALAALFLCCVIVGILAFSSGRESERRNQTPASYAQAAKADAERACIGREGSAAFECIYEKVESSQDQARGEQDLTAQQRAASAALSSAFVALLTLVMTGVGVWFVKGTLEATLKAVEGTSEATDAMREANNIARESQRPWLAANVVRLSRFRQGATSGTTKEDGFFVDIFGNYKNFGATPATDIHTIVSLKIPRAGQSFDSVLDEFCSQWRGKDFKGGPALFAGESREFRHLSFVSQAAIDQALNECGTFKMVSILVLGCVTYRSARFAGVRQTRMMYHVASIEGGSAKVIRPSDPDWWKKDIRIMNQETILPD